MAICGQQVEPDGQYNICRRPPAQSVEKDRPKGDLFSYGEYTPI
jgi:hypothetical protein